jgi:hypothetical protein
VDNGEEGGNKEWHEGNGIQGTAKGSTALCTNPADETYNDKKSKSSKYGMK